MSDGFHQTPFDVIREFLDGRKYVYAATEETGKIHLSICGRHADYRIQFRITAQGEILEITGNFPFRIRDPRNRPSVSELLTRANYAMVLGKFEMDLEDGEVRFHLSQMIGPGSLDPALLERLFTTSVHTLDRYFPAIMQHLHAGFTPGDAVFHAELDLQADQVVTDPVPPPNRVVRPASPAAEPPAASPILPDDPASETPSGGIPSVDVTEGKASAPVDSASAPDAQVREPARRSRRIARRKVAGPENHPEFPF